MYYDDIDIDQRFYKDWNKAPKYVHKAVDKIIRLTLESHTLPNSLNAHKVASKYVPDTYILWIGYITKTKEHYRILFYAEESTLVFYRLFKHDNMDIYLKELVKS
jgi:hypothetical protein